MAEVRRNPETEELLRTIRALRASVRFNTLLIVVLALAVSFVYWRFGARTPTADRRGGAESIHFNNANHKPNDASDLEESLKRSEAEVKKRIDEAQKGINKNKDWEKNRYWAPTVPLAG